MAETATKTQILLARVAVVLMAALVVVGVALHGVSMDALRRLGRNPVERPVGPMSFRFFLQPTMAALAAWRDGSRDARSGRSPCFWTVLTNPAKAEGRLREGLIATSRVILLGLIMDLIYQLMVFGTFHPAEAVIISLALAFVPYVALRGPITPVVARWRGGRTAGSGQ